MSMLAFYPWLKLNRDISFGETNIKVFKTGDRLEGYDSDVQNTIENISRHYTNVTRNPISKFSILLSYFALHHMTVICKTYEFKGKIRKNGFNL